MGVGQSLRKAVGYFGAADRDDYYDDYDAYEPVERDEPRDGAHTLVLMRPNSRDFFLAMPIVFDDVQDIGVRLKADVPVLLDLNSCDRGLSERVLDFCYGLTYALDGHVYRVGENVLLLSPKCVEFSSEVGAEALRHKYFD
jgi:cell division inhibitor SepF